MAKAKPQPKEKAGSSDGENKTETAPAKTETLPTAGSAGLEKESAGSGPTSLENETNPPPAPKPQKLKKGEIPPAPPLDPYQGPKTPAYMDWMKKYHPKDYAKKYASLIISQKERADKIALEQLRKRQRGDGV